ncbi:MAG: patatin-like phospholipase family protein [Actinomycetota bacterium]|nr:patatin-like phospholipase family protein [Actinomycetota bacterium]
MRILAIDGGGIRGLIPAIVLAEVEQRTGRAIADCFDLIAGTSTGGILACALTRPGPGGSRYSAQELNGLYESEGPKIFDRSLLKEIVSIDGNIDERYDDDGLNTALRDYLGDDRISEARTDILVTAYDIERRGAWFFRSALARTDPTRDFTMADAARATSAAPTYFEPALVRPVAGGEASALIDGGVFAVNPSMCALAEVAHAGRRDEIELLASLGTGSHTRPLHYADVRGWGRLEWAAPIIDVVFDGVADTTEFELRQLLAPERYLRLQIELNAASDDLDDASAGNLRRLRAEAERLLREQSAGVDRLVAALSA